MTTSEIEAGSIIKARGADGEMRRMRALSGVIDGADFPVVWACGEGEWEASEAEGRDPQGIPWPAEAVQLAEAVHALR